MIKLFLKNLLISILAAGCMYQAGINDYVEFPKNYPKDYLIYAFSLFFCAFLMTYNQIQNEKATKDGKVKNKL
jgi:hypothetical protein